MRLLRRFIATVYAAWLEFANRPACRALDRQAKVIARQKEQIRRSTDLYIEQQARIRVLMESITSSDIILREQRDALRRCRRRRDALGKMVTRAVEGKN